VHFPKARRYDDVRTFEAEPVDILEGGSPCQGLSVTGLRKGFRDERSGLWSEFARLVGECGPRAVVLENVPGILCASKHDPPAIYTVLSDLAQLGYDAVWTVLSAEMVGATHLRNRVFVLAIKRGAAKLRPSASVRGRPPAAHWTLPPSAHESRSIPSVANVPYHLERIESLGNAVVPQTAHVVGRMLGALLGGRPGAPGGRREETPEWQGELFAAWAQSAMAGAIQRTRFEASCKSAPPQGVLEDGAMYATKALQIDSQTCAIDDCDVPASRGLWATATARDWRSGKASEATRARNSRPLSEAAAPDGFLLPEWTERHMGFPEGWTTIAPGLVTPRKRGTARSGSLARCSRSP